MLAEFMSGDWQSSSDTIDYILRFSVSFWMIVGFSYLFGAAVYRFLRVSFGKTWMIVLESGRRSYFPAFWKFILGSLLYFLLVTLTLWLLP